MAANDLERMDRSHQGTYGFFVSLMKYGAIVSFVVAMFVILIIS